MVGFGFQPLPFHLYPATATGSVFRDHLSPVVKLAARGEHSAAGICGISRSNLFNWLEAARLGGIEALAARQARSATGGSANEATMIPTSGSPGPPVAGNGRAAGGNRVAAGLGGGQPGADPRSRTQVEPDPVSSNGEPPGEWRSLPRKRRPVRPASPVEGQGKGCRGWPGRERGEGVMAGRRDLSGQDAAPAAPGGSRGRHGGVEAGQCPWSQGRQEGGKAGAMDREEPSAPVPARDEQAEEDLWTRHGAGRGAWAEPMLAALARGLEGGKWPGLVDKAASGRTPGPARGKVRANAGACGVDGITAGRSAKGSRKRLHAVKGQPGAGSCQPGPAKRAWIPKPGGGPQGTPRGGVTGPLPADVCLDPLEWMMAAPGFEMVRCADDMAVPCRSRQQAGVAPEKLREWMEGAGPALHPDKTRVVDMEPAGGRFGFPGHRFRRIRRGELVRLARPGSLRGLRESIKPRTYRANGRSMEAIVADLDRTPSGRSACFKHVEAGGPGGLDGWIRMRMRPIPGKRRGLKGRGRGLDRHRRPNRCFTGPGPFRLPDARAAAVASPHHGANHWPESRMRETRTSGSEGGAGQANAPSLPLSEKADAWPPVSWPPHFFPPTGKNFLPPRRCSYNIPTKTGAWLSRPPCR